MTEVRDIAASAKADVLRERLTSAGIAWENTWSSHDYESSDGEMGSRSSAAILVAEADAARARAILAELG